MQRNIENGNVTTISITDITVNKKAHKPGFSPTVAKETKQYR